jgi:hypothetical protein
MSPYGTLMVGTGGVALVVGRAGGVGWVRVTLDQTATTIVAQQEVLVVIPLQLFMDKWMACVRGKSPFAMVCTEGVGVTLYHMMPDSTLVGVGKEVLLHPGVVPFPGTTPRTTSGTFLSAAGVPASELATTLKTLVVAGGTDTRTIRIRLEARVRALGQLELSSTGGALSVRHVIRGDSVVLWHRGARVVESACPIVYGLCVQRLASIRGLRCTLYATDTSGHIELVAAEHVSAIVYWNHPPLNPALRGQSTFTPAVQAARCAAP